MHPSSRLATAALLLAVTGTSTGAAAPAAAQTRALGADQGQRLESTAPPARTQATVVGLWHLDEPSGASVMSDSSGNGANGVVSSPVTTGAAGAAGNGYRFSGRGLVTVGDSGATSLNPGSADVTISAWLQVSRSLPRGDYNVLQKGVANAAGGAYKLEVHGRRGAKFGLPDCQFSGQDQQGAQRHNIVFGPKGHALTADGLWHHVVCRLTATTAQVTVDGYPGAAQNRVVASISNTVPLTVGGKPRDRHNYVGGLDEVCISVGGDACPATLPARGRIAPQAGPTG